MPQGFFNVMVDGEVTIFEKARILSIEPYEFGTKIILEASHTAEEPLVYFTPENYDKVMSSYLA
jgi:hypothetical protein